MASALLLAACAGRGPRPAPANPLEGLGPEEVAELQKAVDQLADTIGCGRRLKGCVENPQGCAAHRHLELLAWLARRGATAQDLLLELGEHLRALARAPAALALADAPCRGPADAPVTVAVFSDFECPACVLAGPLLDSLAQPGGRVRVCFKYFPLDGHRHSRPAAQLAELARERGRFWPMHDLLFENAGSLSLAALPVLAERAGLDPAEAAQVLAQDRYLDRVNASKAEGKAIGVIGTPTLLINGRPYTLPLDGPYLSRAIEDHLELAEGGPLRDCTPTPEETR